MQSMLLQVIHCAVPETHQSEACDAAGPTKAASTATVLCGVSREKAQDEAAQVDS